MAPTPHAGGREDDRGGGGSGREGLEPGDSGVREPDRGRPGTATLIHSGPGGAPAEPRVQGHPTTHVGDQSPGATCSPGERPHLNRAFESPHHVTHPHTRTRVNKSPKSTLHLLR